MSEEPPTLFVYHTDQRRRLRGCMPLFVFVSALLVVGGILLVPIRLTEKPEPPRTGRVYFRNDPLLHFNLRQLSPRPFELPKFVDPAAKNFGRVDVPALPESRLLLVEPPSPFAGSADTFVLEGADLLGLPPEPEAEEKLPVSRDVSQDQQVDAPSAGVEASPEPPADQPAHAAVPELREEEEVAL